jgi:hypothetical protein
MGGTMKIKLISGIIPIGIFLFIFSAFAENSKDINYEKYLVGDYKLQKGQFVSGYSESKDFIYASLVKRIRRVDSHNQYYHEDVYEKLAVFNKKTGIASYLDLKSMTTCNLPAVEPGKQHLELAYQSLNDNETVILIPYCNEAIRLDLETGNAVKKSITVGSKVNFNGSDSIYGQKINGDIYIFAFMYESPEGEKQDLLPRLIRITDRPNAEVFSIGANEVLTAASYIVPNPEKIGEFFILDGTEPEINMVSVFNINDLKDGLINHKVIFSCKENSCDGLINMDSSSADNHRLLYFNYESGDYLVAFGKKSDHYSEEELNTFVAGNFRTKEQRIVRELAFTEIFSNIFKQKIILKNKISKDSIFYSTYDFKLNRISSKESNLDLKPRFDKNDYFTEIQNDGFKGTVNFYTEDGVKKDSLMFNCHVQSGPLLGGGLTEELVGYRTYGYRCANDNETYGLALYSLYDQSGNYSPQKTYIPFSTFDSEKGYLHPFVFPYARLNIKHILEYGSLIPLQIGYGYDAYEVGTAFISITPDDWYNNLDIEREISVYDFSRRF